MKNTKISDKRIKEQYNLIKEYHEKYLKKYGVKMPKLYNKDDNFTINALVLVYLSFGYSKTKIISKTELTNFIRKFYPEVNDVQQARHLGAQDGWWIVAGGRDNIVLKVKRGDYQLYTLEQPYPAFKKGHRIADIEDWEELKHNIIIDVQLAALVKENLIYTGQEQKQYFRRHIWTQINHWYQAI